MRFNDTSPTYIIIPKPSCTPGDLWWFENQSSSKSTANVPKLWVLIVRIHLFSCCGLIFYCWGNWSKWICKAVCGHVAHAYHKHFSWFKIKTLKSYLKERKCIKHRQKAGGCATRQYGQLWETLTDRRIIERITKRKWKTKKTTQLTSWQRNNTDGYQTQMRTNMLHL